MLLPSSRPKDRPHDCMIGFPLDNEMMDKALLECTCISQARLLPMSGPRGRIGTILPERNDPWLNAAPPAWAAFFADDVDIKFPMRLPILSEAHECDCTT